MGVFAKYLVKELFKLLIICELIFISIYLMIDFTGGIDDFVKANASTGVMISYYIYKIPAIAVQMLPAATLTAIIIVFCTMKRNNEIIALRACGINIWRISQPVIITAFFLSIVLFLFSEIIVPYSSAKSNEIWRVSVKKQDPGGFKGQNHIWLRGKSCIYWIKRFDGQKMIMIEPTFYFFDPSFHVIKRIDARFGVWKEGWWRIKEGIVQDREKSGDYYSLSRFKELDLRLPEKPGDFVREEREPEEMGYHQLNRFTERLTMEGYDATEYVVGLNIKIAFPFIVLIMALIGIPVALWKKGMGTPLAVSIGIVLCFFYLLILGVSRSLGLAGVLPPILSAWLANSIFLFLGLYQMMRVNR